MTQVSKSEVPPFSAGTEAKPRVEVQGRAIVERDGDGLLVMFPNGDICRRPDARAAETVIKRWFKARAIDAINVGLIEWRDGVQPPKGAK